jgi:hypothetical protein
MALIVLAGVALAQEVDITPLPTESPSSELAPGTQWVYWMAIGAAVIVILVTVAIAAGYLRFAPKFFGREEKAMPPPPGTRPPALARQAARIRYTPPPAAEHAPTPASAQARTATAVAERPVPAAATAQAATERVTAPPSGEPATQADAVGEAETEAPEERPTAKTAEEVGMEAPAQQAPQEAAPPTPAAPQPAAQPAASAAPAAHSGGGEMDQETFDRVLKEQLDRGVDRRVAEGRARAAAVVAARKKSQA